jgi:hypothetical protein
MRGSRGNEMVRVPGWVSSGHAEGTTGTADATATGHPWRTPIRQVRKKR